MKAVDYAVLSIYLVGAVAIGAFYFHRNQTTRDMFSAGGQSPWWVSGLSSFMTLKSAGTFVVWGGLAYSEGLVAITITTCIGISGILVGLVVAGRWRAIGVGTPAEFIALRFGQSAVQLYTWSMMVIRIVSTGVALYSVAVLLAALAILPEGNPLRDAATGHLSLPIVTAVLGTVIVLYTVCGGLWAVLMTDVLQFIVLQLAVLFVIPLLAWRVMHAPVHVALPSHFYSPVSGAYTTPFLVGWIAVHFFIVGGEWAFAQRYLCVPSIKDAKKSALLFGCLYLINPAIWLAPPLLYRLLDTTAKPEEAYILASRLVLPTGMLGLMMAAMFSATASAISGQLNVFAGILTEQFYRRKFPNVTEAAAVNAGRAFTAILGLALIMIALVIPALGGAQEVILTVTGLLLGPLLAPTIWGLLNGRVGTSAVFTTAITSFLISVMVKFGFLGALANTAIGNWIRLNPRLVDVMCGALVPSIVMFSFQAFARKNDRRWPVIESRLEAYEADPPVTAADVHAAGEITWISLAVTGMLVLSLLAIDPGRLTTVGSFGLILLVLAYFIRAASERKSPISTLKTSFRSKL